jgi:hypothetical protein
MWQQTTLGTFRAASDTGSSSMMNQTMRKIDPFRLRDKRHQIAFDNLRVF